MTRTAVWAVRCKTARVGRRWLALTVMATGVAGCGEGSTGLTSEPPPDALSVEPDVPWFEAILQPDGQTLVIQVGSSPAGDGPCDARFAFDTVQTAERVVVAFEMLHGPSMVEPPPLCESRAIAQRFEITLDDALAGRPIFDGVDPEPRKVRDMAELVVVTYQPPGFRLDDASPGGGEARTGWQQTFTADGLDWYFAVTQGPNGEFLPPYGNPVGTVVVHGIEAEVLEDPSHTIRTIHWLEDGVDIQVWGEMQGPPDFNHDAELLKIAEGLQLPN